MNALLFYSLLSLLSFSNHPSLEKEHTIIKKDSAQKQSGECSNLYLFQGSYINLDNNDFTHINGLPTTDFTKCSKYAHRFINPINDTVYADEHQFIIENNRDKKIYKLHIYKNKALVKTINLPVEKPLPEVHQYSFYLLPYKNNVILFMEDMYTTHYRVCKYNSNGEELMRKDIEHTYIDHPQPNTNKHNRYLYFKDLTASQMVFTSHNAFANKFKTVILSMDDFTITGYHKTANGIILDDKEEKLAGFVTEKDGHFTIQMLNHKNYGFDIKYGNPGCDFILKDNLLYIANYHPIATGSSLHCFDMRTGKMKWTATVLQVNTSHSEYWNKVTLSIYKNKLIMQGDEANGSYLQLFDTQSGERLAHFGNVSEEKK